MFHTISFFIHFFTYWTTSLFFFLCDIAYNRVKHSQYEFFALNVLENHIFVTLPIVILTDTYYPKTNYTELPTSNFIWQIPSLLFLHDFLFYHLHRIMHNRHLYKYHKQHHHPKNNIGAGALYSGKIDFLLVNIAPAYIPTIILQMNLLLTSIWVTISTISTVCIHSGYSYFDQRHSYHHSSSKINYGLGLYLFDRIYGTYRKPKPDLQIKLPHEK